MFAFLGRLSYNCIRVKYRFKTQEGFSLDNLRLPERIFETPSFIGKLDKKFVLETIACVKKEIFKGNMQ